MTDTVMLVGKLASEVDERDAVHIAVAPVLAKEDLAPGQHAGVDGTVERPVGVVDPFLKVPVHKGDWFWLFLYPGTITSLRHDWAHPAFAAERDPKEEAKKWIEGFAASIDQTYNRLMAAADDWIDTGEYTYDNAEKYKHVDHSLWPIFWKRYEAVTGRKPSDPTDSFFTCSC